MTPAIIDAHVHLPCGQIPDIQYCGFSDYEPAVEFASAQVRLIESISPADGIRRRCARG